MKVGNEGKAAGSATQVRIEGPQKLPPAGIHPGVLVRCQVELATGICESRVSRLLKDRIKPKPGEQDRLFEISKAKVVGQVRTQSNFDGIKWK